MFTNQSRKKMLLIFVLIISMIGGIIFFPLKMDSGDTCLFQKHWGSKSEIVQSSNSDADIARKMTEYYINRFALIWWASLIIVIYISVRLKNFQNKKSESKCEP